VTGPVDGFEIRAEIGYTPAFYRAGSEFENDFKQIQKVAELPAGCDHPSNVVCEDFWPEKEMKYEEEFDLSKWDIFNL
jgi:hypothetical protein